MKPFWRSKKWWMAAVAALIPVLNSVFGWEIDPANLTVIILPMIAYVLGEAWVDASH